MARARQRKPRRRRVGRVSYFPHHGAWYVYYRDGQRTVRHRVGESEELAAQVAAEVNGQLASAAPTMFSFVPVSVAELRRRFLDHHEEVLRSSLATVRRYRTATKHLENFAGNQPAHQINVDQFVRHLRKLKIAPNGHSNTARRPLLDKGIAYILETARSLYGYAADHRHLPPYAEIPFKRLRSHRLKIEDAKPIFVFDEPTELSFLQSADDWSFPIFFTYAKAGLRVSELIFGFIEDLDLDRGWWHVRNHANLGWLIKTRRQRAVPLAPEVVHVLRHVIGSRTSGPVFLREKLAKCHQLAGCSAASMARELARRVEQLGADGAEPTREQVAKVAQKVWREAGMARADAIRLAFVRHAQAIGLADVTCPKSWRHTFATLLQEANVDPMIRQVTLGHSSASPESSPLGMTVLYTHLRPEVQHREILRALQLRPKSLALHRRC